ncbi:carbohydrate ABC transporter permease [Paracholeplasma manati]|uniref:carbohydrate ABC transporter permease n=1 Tax=Paracholeplasma manati TaxID=591373 RepID=UPI00240795B9|nr:carbohydrate ABC transporter permease [Paracholeplasma manati]MDG0888974.1 carbohydrate ABC transporter permease [Paracholeplasma manati]
MRRRLKMIQIIQTIFAILLSITIAIPFIWMVIASFYPTSFDLFQNPPRLPTIFRLENYPDAVQTISMYKLIWNTLIIVFANMVFSITASILVAYGFARFKIKENQIIFFILLATMMLPWVVTLVPSYIIYSRLELVGTRWPLILPALGGNAFYIFLLRQYILGIPQSLDEAAEMDGCSKIGILFRIILPQCKPILATLIVFSFVGSWSDYVGPRIYLASNPALQTLSVGLQYFQSTTSVMPWHLLMAACVIFTIPMVITMFISQNAFTEGIVTTGSKG